MTHIDFGWWQFTDDGDAQMVHQITGERLVMGSPLSSDDAPDDRPWSRFDYDHAEFHFPLAVIWDPENQDILVDYNVSSALWRKHANGNQLQPPYGGWVRVDDLILEALRIWPTEVEERNSEGMLKISGGWFNGTWNSNLLRTIPLISQNLFKEGIERQESFPKPEFELMPVDKSSEVWTSVLDDGYPELKGRPLDRWGERPSAYSSRKSYVMRRRYSDGEFQLVDREFSWVVDFSCRRLRRDTVKTQSDTGEVVYNIEYDPAHGFIGWHLAPVCFQAYPVMCLEELPKKRSQPMSVAQLENMYRHSFVCWDPPDPSWDVAHLYPMRSPTPLASRRYWRDVVAAASVVGPVDNEGSQPTVTRITLGLWFWVGELCPVVANQAVSLSKTALTGHLTIENL